MDGAAGMSWSALAAIAVAFIAAGSGWGGAKFARRKEKADAASIITATAMSLLVPLNVEVSKLQASVLGLTDQVARLRGKVTTLETDNTKLQSEVALLKTDNRTLRVENAGLRDRVATLERQITGLGHTPVNGHPAGTVTTSTTEVVTVTEGVTQ